MVGEERQGEFVFEAISETPIDRLAAYTFVLTHGLDDETTTDEGAPDTTHGRLVH